MTMPVKQLPTFLFTVIFLTCAYAPVFCQDVNDQYSSNALISKALHSRTPLIPVNPVANDRDNTMVLLDSVYDTRWNSLMNEWGNYAKVLYEYDTSGLALQEYWFLYNPATAKWGNSKKVVNTYNSQGKITSTVSFEWNILINNWRPTSKRTHEYDAEGHEVLHQSFTWNLNLSNWDNGKKYTYAFDANGNNIEYILYYWDETSGQWIGKFKTTYEFLNNKLQVSRDFNWNESLSDWVKSYKTETHYNNIALADSIIQYSWAEFGNNWNIVWLAVYEYDSNGYFDQITSYDYIENLMTWEPFLRDNYQYDSNGNRLLYEEYDWDQTGAFWQPYGKVESTFSPDQLKAQDIYSFWDTALNDWIPDTRFTYFWSAHDLTNAVKDGLPNQSLLVYPVPASQTINIKNDSPNTTANIYAGNGQLMKTIPIRAVMEQIQISDLPKGIYWLELMDGPVKKTQCFIKQ